MKIFKINESIKKKTINIIGTRGIPARYGGFETFAEKLSLYLVKKKWVVNVFCQEFGKSKPSKMKWNGINLIRIPVNFKGPLSTIIFDFKSALISSHIKGLCLTLGYNTAIFNIFQKFKKQKNIFNMDGIEWERDKWNFFIKVWFYLNQNIAAILGDHLIADNPHIKNFITNKYNKKKISMIPYGAEKFTKPNKNILSKFRLKPKKYSIVIARPEPENSILEIVESFVSKKRNHQLVIFGKFEPTKNTYHKKILEVSNSEVIFVGAIYEKKILSTLRYYCQLYIHGHTAGGTNPSLVEALGSGCVILANNNKFNKWTLGKNGFYFRNKKQCGSQFDILLDKDLKIYAKKNYKRFLKKFQWKYILQNYEKLFLKILS